MTTFDDDWFEKAKKKNERALNVFYNLYKKPIYAFIIQRVKSVEDAEDLHAEIFEKAFFNFHKILTGNHVKSFIYRIATNMVIDYWRKKNAKKRRDIQFVEITEVNIGDNDISPQRSLEIKEIITMLNESLLTLNKRELEAFTLMYKYKKSKKEISELMNTTVRAVEALINHSKIEIRDYFESFDKEEIIDFIYNHSNKINILFNFKFLSNEEGILNED